MELLSKPTDQFLADKQRYFSKNCVVEEFNTHSAKIHTIGWNCNGKKLASGSCDKTITIFGFDRERFKKENTLKGHSESVDQLCWHPLNADLLSSASCDKTVKIWDTKIQQNVNTIQTRGENINITWSPNGQTIAVGDKEDLITFIDTRTFTIIHEEKFKHEVNEISWNTTNDFFFVTNGIGCVIILSYPDLKPYKTLQAHPSNCISIEFDPTGKYFVTGSADALVSLWDLEELICVRVFSRLDWPVRALSFSYDGKILASASEDLFIDIALVETGESIHELSCPGSTFTLAWHPSKYVLAYSCGDRDKNEKEIGSVRLFGVFQS